MRIAVIGAGPAGITSAYQLSKAMDGERVTRLDVYELDTQVGGLAKSLQLWGQKVDMGPHRFFSHHAMLNELWLEVVGDQYKMVDRQTRIFYNKKFFDYPLKPANALRNLGLYEAFRCIFSYLKVRLFPLENNGTFENWVSNKFGKRLFQIFFKTYSEKLWGISCSELDSDFAAQRIKKLNLYEAIKNAMFKGKRNVHKTLVDQFAYPLSGTGSVYEKMAELISHRGGRIHHNTPVSRVITKNNAVRGVELEDGTSLEYDRVISSMPISLMVARLPGVPENIRQLAEKLKFRNTILVYLNIDSANLFPDQWLYIHSEGLRVGRITNFRNWIPELYGRYKSAILCLEFWCNFEEPFWKKDETELIALAERELRQSRLISGEKVLSGHVVRIPHCYPVYFRGYREIMSPIEQYLDEIQNLEVIGRYGAYKYNNQDHSIYMGMLAAENVLENRKNNLWEINTDYESYQEASVITETGIVRQ